MKVNKLQKIKNRSLVIGLLVQITLSLSVGQEARWNKSVSHSELLQVHGMEMWRISECEREAIEEQGSVENQPYLSPP